MTQPPAGSSLLFGALADSGRIKERKNGSYKMVLEGVDEIDWFTDRPDRVEGTWKPQKLLRKWDKYFATSEPNAQAGFKADEEQEMVTFEMFKPKIKSGKIMFNIKPISDLGEDKLTGHKNMEMSDISLFIDDAILSDFTVEDGQTWKGNVIGNVIGDVTGNVVGDVQGNVSGRVIKSLGDATCSLNSEFGQGKVDLSNSLMIRVKLRGADMKGANFEFVNFTGSDLSGANFKNANLAFANLSDIEFEGAIFDGAIFYNTICPDGTNSNDSGNASCGL